MGEIYVFWEGRGQEFCKLVNGKGAPAVNGKFFRMKC